MMQLQIDTEADCLLVRTELCSKSAVVLQVQQQQQQQSQQSQLPVVLGNSKDSFPCKLKSRMIVQVRTTVFKS